MNSKKFKIFITIIITAVSAVFAGTPSFAPVASAKVTSLNGLYIAGVDGISGLSVNPASLAYLKGRALELSVFGRLGQQDYVDKSGALHRSFRDDDIGVTAGAFWNLTDNFTIGVDYNNSVQSKVDWPFAIFVQGDSSSGIFAFDHYNNYTITSINPSAALNFGSFSIGLSVNVLNVKHTMGFYQGNSNWESMEAGIAAYQVKVDEDAWAFGGTLGFQGYLTPQLKIGAFVKSTISASLEGDAESRLFADLDSTDSKTSVSSEFELPWTFGLGALYDISDNLKLNVDATYSLWGSTQEIQKYKYGNSFWSGRFSEVDSLSGYTGANFSLKYQNAFSVGFGLEYDPHADVVVRFGYKFSQTRNTDETYSYLYPGVDQHWLSLGIGFWFEAFYVDMAIAYGTSTERTVSQNENKFFAGKYSGDIYIPSINIKYQF